MHGKPLDRELLKTSTNMREGPEGSREPVRQVFSQLRKKTFGVLVIS